MINFIYALFTFLCLTYNVYSQLPEFSKIYNSSYAYFRSIQQLNSSGYILCGGNKDSFNDSISIVKLSLAGEIEWTRLFYFPTIPNRSFLSVADTNLIIVAWQDSNKSEIKLSYLNSGGNNLREITFPLLTEVSIKKIITFAGQTFVILHTANGRLALVCFDLSGGFKWQFAPSMGAIMRIDDALILPDSTFLISSPNGMIKLDKNGDHLFTKSFPLIENLCFAEDGYIIGTGRSSYRLIKFDYDANLIFNKYYTSNSPIAVVYSPLGFYYAASNNSKLMKIDLSGNMIGEIPTRQIVRAINVASDNGLLLVSSLFASKTDENGESNVIDLIAPNGGEIINVSTSCLITWYSSQQIYVNIDFSGDGGASWQRIINYYPGTGYFSWKTPVTNLDSCLIKITNSADPSIFDISDDFFILGSLAWYEYIAANDILMWIGNNGDGSHDPRTDGNGFYWPGGINNTGESAIFEDGLVWGGKINGELRANGNLYRQGIRPGNILPDGSPADPLDPKYRVYKIKKDWEYLSPSPERDKYEFNYINWPVDLGAPWIDGDNNGIYTPGIDQPEYIGDEVLFYVANDLDTAASNNVFGSDPVGLEFQTVVYAFDKPALSNVVFKKYSIINKSPDNYSDVYFMYWADCDLGDANDDWSGIDTSLLFSYTYNATNSDGIYGSPPPAVGHLLLQSPIEPAGLNDSAYVNSHWIKGYKNISINSGGMMLKHPFPAQYPVQPVATIYQGTIEVYNIMMGLANNGNIFTDPNTGIPSKYCVPGDPVSGTGWYNGGGWSGGPPPGDFRHHITCGPFNMAPGDTQEVVYAIFIAQGSDNIQSIAELRNDAQYYRNQYYNNFPVSVEDADNQTPDEYALYQNYPNPFNPSTKIKFSVPTANQVTLKVYDILGRETAVLISKEMLPGNYEVDFNEAGLASGVYFYRIEAGGFVSTKKMILLR